MSPRVAVTGAGGAAAIGLMRALVDDPIDIYALDADPVAAGLYLVPPTRRAVAPLGRSPEFAGWLLEWCKAHRIDLLVPTVEDEFAPLAAARDRFVAVGIGLLLEPTPTIDRCTDKWRLARDLGRQVPQARTELVDATFDPSTWTFPLVVKPRTASGSRGIVIAADIHALATVPRDGTCIAQQYLPGPEYSVDVLVGDAGDVLAAVPRERLKVDSGIAVAARTVRDPELVRVATAAAQAAGIRQMANVQLRRDGRGCARLLEINARIPGTVALTIAAGVNMPRHVVRRALGLPVEWVDGGYRDVAMVRMLDDLVCDPAAFDALTPPVAVERAA